MSSTMKVGLLALVSTVAAVPHYNHHKHHKSGYGGHGTGTGAAPAYPTGINSTALPFATGSGSPEFPVEPTTTIINTAYETETIISTIYATRSGAGGVLEPSSVGAVQITSGVASICGPETVFVTATEKVTVTVSAPGPSGAVSVISEAPASASSSAPGPSPPDAVYSAPVNYNEPAPSSAPAPAPAPTPEPAPAPVSSPSPAPAEPKTEEPKVEPTPEPTPSAAPKPVTKPVSSGGASYSGGKRGLAYNDVSLCNSFSGGKFGFAYNWAQSESSSLPDGIQFIPMMHKTSDSTAEAFLANVDAAVAKGTTAVMGFNEPDHAEQANMSPEAACDAWASYLQPITSSHPDVAILSPSVTNGPAPMGLDWLSRFQKNCPSATWHAANIHFYDQYDDQTFDRFKAHVELAISTFNKPLWITEFGLNPGTATPDQASSFLKQAVEYLDGNASVQGYAWFMVGTDTSFNMLNAGNGLSATGQIYASS